VGKGDDFERDQCRFLSLWWTKGARDDIFWRNRRHRTIKDPTGRHQLGDITALQPEGIPFVEIFNVELKTGYSKTKKGKRVKNIPWDVLDLIDHTGSEPQDPVLLRFWEQTYKDASLSKRLPLLIFKRDYHVPVVCIEEGTLRSLIPRLEEPSYPRVQFSRDDIALVMFREEHFFSWLTPEVVKEIHRGY